MTLDANQIRRLIEMIAATRDHEIDCDDCLMELAEFAETRLANVPLREGLTIIEGHLETCPDCHEEYQALVTALRDTRPRSEGGGPDR